jgi:hypothetical protein
MRYRFCLPTDFYLDLVWPKQAERIDTNRAVCSLTPGVKGGGDEEQAGSEIHAVLSP